MRELRHPCKKRKRSDQTYYRLPKEVIWVKKN